MMEIIDSHPTLKYVVYWGGERQSSWTDQVVSWDEVWGEKIQYGIDTYIYIPLFSICLSLNCWSGILFQTLYFLILSINFLTKLFAWSPNENLLAYAPCSIQEAVVNLAVKITAQFSSWGRTDAADFEALNTDLTERIKNQHPLKVWGQVIWWYSVTVVLIDFPWMLFSMYSDKTSHIRVYVVTKSTCYLEKV